ncbi:MAG: hypothetical protein ABFS32_13095, partial [Bacteroidota bacterium]
MSSILPNYQYDIFISYRQKDNKADQWVTLFVEALKDEIEATFKEDISIYFDENPHDGLLETHDVDQSLKEKIKVLVFIPIISQTYCDPNCYAWEHEFVPFRDFAIEDELGLDIRLDNGNVCKRILPVRIHEIDQEDQALYEKETGGVMRSINFIYKASGVNRPLMPFEIHPGNNLNGTVYRDQINKVANAIKEIISGRAGANQNEDYFSSKVTEVHSAESNTPDKKSIIVLPFENMSSDPEQEYFSDGLTEEVIADLSHVHDLLVISRSSAMTFKGKTNTIGEIAKKVNVRYVLEGSVRKAGNNLRITAQLIDALTDAHIWAEKYTGTLGDIFDIQEKVSYDIVAALKLKLTTEEKTKIASRPIDDFEAYDFYLKAYQAFWVGTEEALDSALKYLQHAAEIIGDNSLLFSAMSLIYIQYVNVGIKHHDYTAKSLEFAQKAFELNPDSAQAHHVIGFTSYLIHGDMDNATRHCKHAHAIEPSLPGPLNTLIGAYCYCGKISAAIPLVEKHKIINPLSYQRYFFEGFLHFYDGNYKAALDPLRHAFEINPKGLANWLYAWAYAYDNRHEQAISVIDKGLKKDYNSTANSINLMLKFALINEK